MSEHLIRLNDVSLHYTGDPIAGVSGINLQIRAGSFTAIVGESGSGKSTLLKLIFGLLTPDSGTVLYDGKKVPGPHEKLIPGHDEMKMLSQHFELNTYAKVYENIESLLSNENLSLKKTRARETMELLSIDHLAERRVAELSGGEQQRVALARAIITRPKVLLLDEPFSQLDAVLKAQFRADLKQLSLELGITVIMVSHDPTDGLTLADQIVILKKGQLLESGEPKDVYNYPRNIYTAKLLANAFVLPASEAAMIGIKSHHDRVLVYPEWVELKSSWTSRSYRVEQVFFRGFYEELLLERKGVKITAISARPGTYRQGQAVQVKIVRFLEFD